MNTHRFQFKDWTIESTKGHILASKGETRDKFENNIKLPHLPDMLFAHNYLTLKHKDGFGLEFNPFDSLLLVDPTGDLIKVGVSKEWKESRTDSEFIHKMVKPFDWTFTTPYKGTLSGDDNNKMTEKETDERIDMEKLKIPEQISFFDEVCLFEDELSDHGTAHLNVKIRVMPNSFFILQRFFLRVDDVVIRVYDTRIHYETQNKYMIREYLEKESLVKDLRCSPRLFIEPNEIASHLETKVSISQRLDFPQ